MDYFLLHECIFINLLKNQKEFIIRLLNSLNIKIKDYRLFELDIKSDNMKVDILLFSDNNVINIQLNKEKISLKRNKVYYETLQILLSNYNVIQININLFKENKKSKGIYNFYNKNEYIKFIASKNYNKFKTKNKQILKIIKYINKLDKKYYLEIIRKEEKIKQKLDYLITD